MPDNALTRAKREQQTRTRSKPGLFQRGKLDLTFLFLVLILLATGLVMLFSASAPYASTYYNNSYHFITRQLVFAVAGVIAMLFISKINYHILKNLRWIFAGVTAALLCAVLVMPEAVPGFKRWIAIGSFTFQPSEIAKFTLTLLLAYFISRYQHRMGEWKFILELFLIIGVTCGLVILEKHLSATILIFAIGIALLFAGGMKIKWMVGIGGVGIGGFVIAVLTGLISYGSDRITYWLDPWADPQGLGYQTIQSLLAIGSGGLMGQGLGESNQKYLWVPEPQNDFIFSIVCEELGLIGALLIVVAFALLVWRGFVIAMRSADKFGALLVIGITFHVGLQTVLNMLVVTNTIPNTGISLPFFSYGGSALLMLLAEMGVILSVSRRCNMEKV